MSDQETLEEFAKRRGLPYDMTGTVDMSETMQAYVNYVANIPHNPEDSPQ